MTVTYEIFVKLYEDGRLLPRASEFLEKFASYQRKAGAMFSFAKKRTALEAMTMAKRHRLEAQIFYFSQVEPHEFAAQPGFYLAADVEEYILERNNLQPRFLTGVDLALDLQTDTILVRERLRRLLDQHTRGMETAPLGEAGGRNWFQITRLPALPEPIFVPQPMYFRPNETPAGTYAVQSDGRDVLTEANIDWLHKHGLAVSHDARTPSDRVSWRPRVLVSGNLMVQLQREYIRGLTTPPVPLLTEQQATTFAADLAAVVE